MRSLIRKFSEEGFVESVTDVMQLMTPQVGMERNKEMMNSCSYFEIFGYNCNIFPERNPPHSVETF